MVDEALVVLLATAELLLHSALDTAGDDLLFRVAVEVIGALNHRHVLVVGDVLAINSVVRRFGETEVVDGVKDIGFALTVETNETIEFIRESELRFTDILVVDYGKGMEHVLGVVRNILVGDGVASEDNEAFYHVAEFADVTMPTALL